MVKRVSFNILKVILVLTIIFTTLFIGIGCSEIEEVTNKIPIENIIDEIRSSSNYVEFEDINSTFLDAVVAIEDHRFYMHGAVDFISIARATLTNIKNGKIVEGGSTITQQLAKNLFLTNEKTLKRKIKEVFLAYELEKKYTKEDILELYVNVIYYGDGFTGIKEACNGYFDKEPSDINYDESTLLAGLPQAPSRYSLNTNYDRAVKRQAMVIVALNQYLTRA